MGWPAALTRWGVTPWLKWSETLSNTSSIGARLSATIQPLPLREARTTDANIPNGSADDGASAACPPASGFPLPGASLTIVSPCGPALADRTAFPAYTRVVAGTLNAAVPRPAIRSLVARLTNLLLRLPRAIARTATLDVLGLICQRSENLPCLRIGTARRTAAHRRPRRTCTSARLKLRARLTVPTAESTPRRTNARCSATRFLCRCFRKRLLDVISRYRLMLPPRAGSPNVVSLLITRRIGDPIATPPPTVSAKAIANNAVAAPKVVAREAIRRAALGHGSRPLSRAPPSPRAAQTPGYERFLVLNPPTPFSRAPWRASRPETPHRRTSSPNIRAITVILKASPKPNKPTDDFLRSVGRLPRRSLAGTKKLPLDLPTPRTNQAECSRDTQRSHRYPQRRPNQRLTSPRSQGFTES